MKCLFFINKLLNICVAISVFGLKYIVRLCTKYPLSKPTYKLFSPSCQKKKKSKTIQEVVKKKKKKKDLFKMQTVNTNNYLNIPLILPNMGRWNTSNQYQLKIKIISSPNIFTTQKTQTGFGAVFKNRNKKWRHTQCFLPPKIQKSQD